MERALLTFTPSLSKRLIAKGVAAMPEVQRAFGGGKLLISTGTTTTFLYGELCGEMPEGPLACGMVTEKGLCVGSGMTDFLGSYGHAKYWYFEKGRPVASEDIDAVLDGFSAEDVFIKGANALDCTGQAGIMLGVESGGLTGRAIGYVMARGIQFVIPVGLEKSMLGSVVDSAREMGTRRVEHVSGMPVGMMPVSGNVVTECRSLEGLADVKTSHVASGGVAGAEGAVVLLVKGEASEIQKILSLYQALREEDSQEPIPIAPAQCAKHKWRTCMATNMFYKGNVKEGK